MTSVSNTISKFITESPVKHITAASVIYKALEINSTISKDELFQLSINAINTVQIDKNSDRYKKLCEIPNQVCKF